MTTNDTYLAVFLGSKTSPRMKAWMALPEAERRAKEQEGMAAWKTCYAAAMIHDLITAIMVTSAAVLASELLVRI